MRADLRRESGVEWLRSVERGEVGAVGEDQPPGDISEGAGLFIGFGREMAEEVEEAAMVVVGRIPAIGFGRGGAEGRPGGDQAIDAGATLFERREGRIGFGREPVEEGGGFGRLAGVPLGEGGIDPLGESRRLDLDAPPGLPCGGRGAFDELASVVGPRLPILQETGERCGEPGLILGRDGDDLGSESVRRAVESRPGLALGRFGSGRFLGVSSIGFDLHGGGHRWWTPGCVAGRGGAASLRPSSYKIAWRARLVPRIRAISVRDEIWRGAIDAQTKRRRGCGPPTPLVTGRVRLTSSRPARAGWLRWISRP
jgi:hypothetical protein